MDSGRTRAHRFADLNKRCPRAKPLAGYCRRTISLIQIGAKGEVQPFEVG